MLFSYVTNISVQVFIKVKVQPIFSWNYTVGLADTEETFVPPIEPRHISSRYWDGATLISCCIYLLIVLVRFFVAFFACIHLGEYCLPNKHGTIVFVEIFYFISKTLKPISS